MNNFECSQILAPSIFQFCPTGVGIVPPVNDPCCSFDDSCPQVPLPFLRNPEFKVRLPPPEPYPPRVTFEPQIRPYDPEESILDEPDLTCREIPGVKWTSRLCLQRIHAILISPEVESMGERVGSIWCIYLRKSPMGLLVKEADVMANILLQLNAKFLRLDYGPDFLDAIMDHLSRGLQIRRMGEALEIPRLAYSLTLLGNAMYTSVSPQAQIKMLEILLDWLNRATKKGLCVRAVNECPDNPNLEMAKVIPDEMFIEALEKSRLPQILAGYVLHGSYTDAYCDALFLLRRCCEASARIRASILTLPIMDPLLIMLSHEDSSNKILGRTVELIFCLLGQPFETNNKISSTPCPHEKAFEILLVRFFKQITQFSSKLLLNVRNDTAFVICLLTKNVPQVREKFGKFASAVTSLVSSNVLGEKCIPTPYIIDSTLEDIELLKYLLWMIQLIIESGLAKKMIYEFQLVSLFFRILMGPSSLIKEIEKTGEIDSIKIIAWGALVNITKQEPKALLQEDGVPTMLEFLKNYIANETTNMRTLSMFTHLLRIILSNEDEKNTSEIIPYFKNLGALGTFIDTIKHMTVKNFNCNDEPILCNLLFCCASLGKYDTAGFTLSNGVKVLNRLIGQLLNQPANERHMNPTVHIAVTECILRCVTESSKCLETFLAYEGVLKLLDLLELSAGPSASIHIFNCILELCEYPRCMDQILFWRRPMRNLTQRYAFGDGFNLPDSKIPGAVKPMIGEALGDITGERDHTLSAMLCDLWRDEEKRLGVLRDSDGCISSLGKPLMSSFAREFKRREGKARVPSEYPGPSCLDSIGSVRPKIFLLVKKITEWVNTEAQLFDSLGLTNQITMQIMINFLSLKQGEIWTELLEELIEEKDQLRLVSTDQKAVELLVKIAKNKVSAVIETQRYLIQREAEKEEIHERELYSMFQKCHLQSHLQAVREAEYIARTTNYTYLVEQRLWQKTQLENASIKGNANVRIHRSTDSHLNFTVWPFKTKMFISEPPADEGALTVLEPQDHIPVGQTRQDSKVVIGTRGSSSSSVEKGGRDKSASEDRDRHSLNVSLVTIAEGEGVEQVTPNSSEPGFYQVSPAALRKALEQVLVDRKKLGWENIVNTEESWKVRAKWRQDWYPEEELRKTKFNM